MSPIVALAALAALVAVAAAAGLLLRRREGRVRTVGGDRLTAEALGVAAAFGEQGTLVQFSTPGCARCPGTARLLREVASHRPGLAHVEVDLARHPDVADRFRVLQTPTTLLLDADRRLVARIGGAPRRDELEQHLTALGGARA